LDLAVEGRRTEADEADKEHRDGDDKDRCALASAA
jgi:hypothetical protein